MQKIVDGLLTHYEILGGGKKHLVILHGWGGSMVEWRPVADELRSKYQVVLLDLPGLGDTARPKEDWGIFEYAEFVNQFLISLKVTSAVVMGHSFGGRIAILLAARYSQLVDRIVLVDAAGMEVKSLKARLMGSAFMLPVRLVKRFLPENLKKNFRSEDYKKAGALRGILGKVVSQNLRDELTKISCPTLIIWGEKDHVLSLKEAEMLKRGINNSRLRIIWGATHWPFMEKQTAFLQTLQEENV